MKNTLTTFPEKTRPEFLKLMALKEDFRSLDLASLPDLELDAKLAEIESQEMSVMLAWAEETATINPGMMSDVRRGLCRYTSKTERILTKAIELQSSNKSSASEVVDA